MWVRLAGLEARVDIARVATSWNLEESAEVSKEMMAARILGEQKGAFMRMKKEDSLIDSSGSLRVFKNHSSLSGSNEE